MALKQLWIGTTGPFYFDDAYTGVYPDGLATRAVRVIDDATGDEEYSAGLVEQRPHFFSYYGGILISNQTVYKVELPGDMQAV